MSYRCDNCDAVQYGKLLAKVTEIRNVVYNRVFNKKNRRDKSVTLRLDSSFDGEEIVNVDKLCKSCYDTYKDRPPKVSNKVKEVNFFGKRKKPKPTNTEVDEKGTPDIKGLKKHFERGK